MSKIPKGLFLFVEGTDDERFFRSIIKPELERYYGWVKLQRYAQTSSQKTADLIANIPKIGADYILVADIDDCPCASVRKHKVKRKLTLLEDERIIVVKKEIESWYLAGLSNNSASALRIPPLPSTDGVDKERFDDLMPESFDSRIDFMTEILKKFSVEAAKQKNKSFEYFWEKHCS